MLVWRSRWAVLGVCCSLLAGCGGGPEGEESLAQIQEPLVLINATFDSSSNGFTYVDDTFGTTVPNGASGVASGGMLHVTLGQVFNAGAQSGGWRNTFNATGPVTGSFFYRITPAAAFETGECNEIRMAIDGTTIGSGANPWVARVCGPSTTSGTFNFTSASLASGSHTITIGGYLNANTEAPETATFDIDNVVVNGTPPVGCGDLVCNNGETCATCPGDCPCPPTEVAFIESAGQVVMEAENHTGNTPQGGRQWDPDSTGSPSGGQSRRANPNSGLVVNTGYVTGSPRLDYRVSFTQTGTYHVWLRGRAVSGPTGNNTVHAGINGAATSTADRMSGFTTSFTWRRTTLDGPTSTVSVPAAGFRTFNVWMREDGFVVDKILLTTNASLPTPSGTGPAQSARLNVCGDNTCNGAETCSSCPADCACPTCPNGTCGTGETCSTCPQDCGACPACPDGQCNGTETCSTCPQDCQPCAPTCPNGSCDAGETCSTCAQDCGTCSWGLDTRPPNPTCLAPPPLATGFALNRRWPDVTFSQPLGLAQAPGDDLWFYVVEKTGEVRRISTDDGATTSTSFLNLTSVVNTESEGGLLALAFHPGYATNRYFFVSYTRNVGSVFTQIISRFQATSDGSAVVAASERVLLSHPKARTNHNAGNIAFGLDGFLYVSLGDDAWMAPNDMLRAAQTDNFYGKLLRIDPSTTASATPPYTIPSSNPFVGVAGLDEIYAYGLRNPWRFSFDRLNGNLWLADVGEDRFEEIDRIVSGGFYGWPHREADYCFPGRDCTLPYTSPEFAYAHGGPLSITGGYVYRGTAIPELQGHYVYGDYITGDVWEYDIASHFNRSVRVGGGNLSAFGEDNAGELYGIRISSGTIEKLERTTGGGPTEFPALITDTGCFTGSPPALVPAAIPYTIALPFWSDGAEKERYLALPDGQRITIDSQGDWVLPAGGVTIKNFLWGNRLIETRFFVRHQNGTYSGYTYEWNDTETQATLVATGGKTRALTSPTGTWSYPSRSGCFACHTDAAGGSLGLETRQLNINEFYESTMRTANQLVTLDHIGMLTGNLATMTPFPAIADTGVPLLERSKAYLHVNCSNCHRPGGPGRGPMDGRYQTPFGDMRLCNEPPTLGGPAGAMLLKPSTPSLSMIFTRMNQRVDDFMPPLASSVVDSAGASLLSQWITGTTSCPPPTVLSCIAAGNDVQNCDFAGGTNLWLLRTNASGVAGSHTAVGNELRIDVTSPGANTWEPQVVQILGSVVAGSYQVEITARAASPRTIVVNVGEEGDDYSPFCEHQLSLTTTMTKYTRACPPVPSDNNVKFDINVGGPGNTASVFVDDVYFGPPR